MSENAFFLLTDEACDMSLGEPTGALRWRSGVLEQQYRHISWSNGKPVGCHFEWRDVPSVDEDQAHD